MPVKLSDKQRQDLLSRIQQNQSYLKQPDSARGQQSSGFATPQSQPQRSTQSLLKEGSDQPGGFTTVAKPVVSLAMSPVEAIPQVSAISSDVAAQISQREMKNMDLSLANLEVQESPVEALVETESERCKKLLARARELSGSVLNRSRAILQGTSTNNQLEQARETLRMNDYKTTQKMRPKSAETGRTLFSFQGRAASQPKAANSSIQPVENSSISQILEPKVPSLEEVLDELEEKEPLDGLEERLRSPEALKLLARVVRRSPALSGRFSKQNIGKTAALTPTEGHLITKATRLDGKVTWAQMVAQGEIWAQTGTSSGIQILNTIQNTSEKLQFPLEVAVAVRDARRPHMTYLFCHTGQVYAIDTSGRPLRRVVYQAKDRILTAFSNGLQDVSFITATGYVVNLSLETLTAEKKLLCHDISKVAVGDLVLVIADLSDGLYAYPRTDLIRFLPGQATSITSENNLFNFGQIQQIAISGPILWIRAAAGLFSAEITKVDEKFTLEPPKKRMFGSHKVTQVIKTISGGVVFQTEGRKIISVGGEILGDSNESNIW